MMHLMLAVAAAFVCFAMLPTSTAVYAQATKPREAFDVASIKRAASTSMYRILTEPSGLIATDVTALDLIKFSYEVIERDVVGKLPAWMKTTRFDVVARTDNGPLSLRRVRAMTRVLLEERFQLDASIEKAAGPVLALVTQRADGRTGPNLRTSETNCQVDAPLETFDPTPRKVLSFGGKCGLGYATSGGALAAMFGVRVTMRQFAGQLSRVGGFDRPIEDRTGLQGEFDFHAAPTADMVAPTSQARFVIALREQLGLTLRAEEGTYEVLTIRRIEQPSPN